MVVNITAPSSPTDEPFTVTVAYDLPAGTFTLFCTVAEVTAQKTGASGKGTWTTASFTPGAGPQTILATVSQLPDEDSKDISVNGPGMG